MFRLGNISLPKSKFSIKSFFALVSCWFKYMSLKPILSGCFSFCQEQETMYWVEHLSFGQDFEGDKASAAWLMTATVLVC